MDKQDFQIEFGNRIARRRQELNMTQEELARKLGYKTKSSINKIEKGKSDIPQSKIIAFSAALDMPVEQLMGWEQTESDSEYSYDNMERKLLSYFRKLSFLNQSMVIGYVRGVYEVQELEIEDMKKGAAPLSNSEAG